MITKYTYEVSFIIAFLLSTCLILKAAQDYGLEGGKAGLLYVIV